MPNLNEQISQLKDDHAQAVVDERGAAYAEKARLRAGFILGRIKQTDTIADAIASNLYSQTILALERFQEDKLYKALGYDRFDDFLEQDEMSPMSKSRFYERRKLIAGNGPEVFDLLTAVGISVRSQKMLAGEVAIRGDKLVIGEEEVAITENAGLIKDVIEKVVDEKRDLQKTIDSQAKKLETQKQQIAAGESDLEQLQRNLDALRAKNPHDRALAEAVITLLELSEVIGTLPDAKKAPLGSDSLPVLNTALQRVRAA